MSVAKPSKSDPSRVDLATPIDRDGWCAERLGRALCTEPLFRRRVRALIVAGVLAFSAVGTGTSVATETDEQGEGLSEPGQGAPAPLPEPPASPGEPVESLGEQGGGGALPADPGAQSPPESTTDDDLLEPEPADDPYGRLVLSEPEPTTAPPDDQSPLATDPPAPPAEEVPAPVAPLTPPDETLQPDTGLAPPTSKGSPQEPASQGDQARPRTRIRQTRRSADRRAARKRATVRKRAAARRVAAARGAEPSPPVISGQTPAALPVAQAPAHSVTTVAPAAKAPRGVPRFHVVRRGESLWSIADALLGPRASTVAIARQVARLWLLNARRIGTGDPSVLPVGVRLRLR